MQRITSDFNKHRDYHHICIIRIANECKKRAAALFFDLFLLIYRGGKAQSLYNEEGRGVFAMCCMEKPFTSRFYLFSPLQKVFPVNRRKNTLLFR